MIDDFGLFWNAYPRKISVVSTRQAWAVAITKVSPAVILEAVKKYASDPNRDPTFTSAPAKWLEEERWMDDPAPPRKLTLDELKERDLRFSKQRDEIERKRALEAHREAEEARKNAVPMPPEIKQQLLELWSKRAYPEP